MRARTWLTPLLVALVAAVVPAAAPVPAADARAALEQPATERLVVPGLERPVEILKDLWGVSHIYAETEHDLFFAQGYNAVRDRLFQFEIWRRQATGTVAEILGEEELERDRGSRLFRFRGDLGDELNHYHPRGAQIIRAFVDGINAYIAETERDPSLLPIEFEILGIRPRPWTPEAVISRHQGLLWNIEEELELGQAVASAGPDAVKEVVYFHPGEPDIALDPAIDGSLLRPGILDLYRAFHSPIEFRREHVGPAFRPVVPEGARASARDLPGVSRRFTRAERTALGSNNWVVSGEHTLSGRPIMANDPHRVLAAPSLRYVVHLVGPGWNVIGGGEPILPGVSIGHNEYGAWGLTVFLTDAEDLYVYETDPDDPNRYRYGDGWERMEVVIDTIPVKDAPPQGVELKYTRHGPVVYEDPENGVAYAVRAGWLEIGGAPYLASLRMDQARTWEEFREACNYSHIPGENMVWVDAEGNIGWQAVGIAPIRRNWTGLVPVPGDGRYEWDGYLEIVEKPNVENPPQGFWATANENLVPPGYPHRDAVGWTWSEPFRKARLVEVLGSGRRFTMPDMMELQTDYVSVPARSLVPMLDLVTDALSPEARWAAARLASWDHALDPDEAEPAIYVSWERRVRREIAELAIPPELDGILGSVSMKKVLDWLASPPPWFAEEADGDPVAGRDSFLVRTFEEALDDLEERLGPDPTAWRYGGEAFKHVTLRHPLSGAVDETTRARLEVGPAPRGGNGYTVNMTAFGDNQSSGASFRIIAEAGDWDTAVFTNSPGQGGDPDDPMYRNLFDRWAADGYFPLYYGRDRVEAAVAERIELDPDG